MKTSRWAETIGVGVLLSALAATVFGSHVKNGGFYSDDWPVGATYDMQGFHKTVAYILRLNGSRPLFALIQPTRYALLGTVPARQLAAAVALAVLASLVFYVLLRELAFTVPGASAVAALALLFPWADSIKLWSFVSTSQVVVILYLLGAILALKSFRAKCGRSWFLGAAATASFVSSVLTYEVTAALAVVTGALYLTRAPRRRAIVRWGIDAIAVGGAAVYSLSATHKGTHSFHAQLSTARELTKTSATLTTQALFPVRIGRLETLGVAIGAAAIVAVSAWVAWRASPTEVGSSGIRRLVAVAVAAPVAIIACYAVYVPGGAFTAWSSGFQNRVNLLASLAIATFVFAVVSLFGRLVGRLRPSIGWLPSAITSVAIVAIGASYVSSLRADERLWDRAAAGEARVLEAIDAAIPAIPRGSTVFTFGYPAETAPGIHIFATSWDLFGAIRLRHHDDTLAAYPVLAGSSFLCGERSITPKRLTGPYGDFHLTDNSARSDVPYGFAYFVDVPGRRATRPDNRATCLEAAARARVRYSVDAS